MSVDQMSVGQMVSYEKSLNQLKVLYLSSLDQRKMLQNISFVHQCFLKSNFRFWEMLPNLVPYSKHFILLHNLQMGPIS
jgi:hypothetical protein